MILLLKNNKAIMIKKTCKFHTAIFFLLVDWAPKHIKKSKNKSWHEKKITQNTKFLCNNMLRFSMFEQSSALINGNNEETNRYIHEKNRVKRESFSPWVDCWTHERICCPRTPSQCYTYHNQFHYHVVLQHTD